MMLKEAKSIEASCHELSLRILIQKVRQHANKLDLKNERRVPSTPFSFKSTRLRYIIRGKWEAKFELWSYSDISSLEFISSNLIEIEVF